MESQRAGCTASGPAAFVLRVARAVGVAPLHFTKVRGAWRVRVSRAASLYTNILTISVCLLALVKYIIDIYLEPAHSEHTVSKAWRFIYFVNLFIIILLGLVWSMTGAARMNSVVMCLNQLQMINSELGNYCLNCCNHLNDKTSWRIIGFSMMGGIFTFALDVSTFTHKVVEENGKILTSLLHISFVFQYICQLVLATQIAVISMSVLSSFNNLNSCLKRFLPETDPTAMYNTMITPLLCKPKINNFVLRNIHTTKSVESLLPLNQRSDMIKDPTKSSCDIIKAIHHLAILHTDLCNVVRDLNTSHGPVYIAFLSGFFLQLIISTYGFIKSLVTNDPSMSVFSLIVPIAWGSFYAGVLILIIEPCHSTHEEMEDTKDIINQLTGNAVSSDYRLHDELELFYMHLYLNAATYRPMQMVTLNRALYISIVTAIATYLVIVIQY